MCLFTSLIGEIKTDRGELDGGELSPPVTMVKERLMAAIGW